MITRDVYNGIPEEVQRFKQSYAIHLSYLDEKAFGCCNATVGWIGKYVYLRSHDTIVAFIDTKNYTAYDILRTEYGYTPTSAQHIGKFFNHFKDYVGVVLRTDYEKGCRITKLQY